MRILHLTDTHLGHAPAVRGHPVGWRKGQDHLRALREALEPALREEVDLVLHTGDLFDRAQPPVPVQEEAAALLAEVARRAPVVILRGNHEARGVARSLPHRLEGVTVVDEPSSVRVRGLKLACIPHQRRAEAWAEDARVAWSGGADLVLAHQAFHGATVPGWTFRVGQERDTVGPEHLPPSVRLILCGHVHTRQVTEVGAALVVQPGSTERTSFNERHEPKGACLWELGGGVRWRFFNVATRPMALVACTEELDQVGPGSLVKVAKSPQADRLEREVLERGGWLCGRARPPRPRGPDRQRALFH